MPSPQFETAVRRRLLALNRGMGEDIRRLREDAGLTRAAVASAAYPAHPGDALDALTGTAPWPGPALVWATVEGSRVRFGGGR